MYLFRILRGPRRAGEDLVGGELVSHHATQDKLSTNIVQGLNLQNG